MSPSGKKNAPYFHRDFSACRISTSICPHPNSCIGKILSENAKQREIISKIEEEVPYCHYFKPCIRPYL
jgi:hypothetical protein